MNYRDLSSPERQLIRCCQEINFGRIAVELQGGAPKPGVPVRVTRTVKLTGAENGPRPETARPDFQLRSEHIALLTALRRLADGTQVVIRVSQGLPASAIDIEEERPAA